MIALVNPSRQMNQFYQRMLGIELDRPCGDLVSRALEKSLLINVTVDNVVRLLPPLTLKQEEAQQIVDILVPLIREYLAEQPAAASTKK